ncbi:MAG: extracellular solute-binding protein [Ruminococcus sp.]|jgi:hypothetical protein|nr:extracellular solute-binding protein [Ruminococcus sp.]
MKKLCGIVILSCLITLSACFNAKQAETVVPAAAITTPVTTITTAVTTTEATTTTAAETTTTATTAPAEEAPKSNADIIFSAAKKAMATIIDEDDFGFEFIYEYTGWHCGVISDDLIKPNLINYTSNSAISRDSKDNFRLMLEFYINQNLNEKLDGGVYAVSVDGTGEVTSALYSEMGNSNIIEKKLAAGFYYVEDYSENLTPETTIYTYVNSTPPLSQKAEKVSDGGSVVNIVMPWRYTPLSKYIEEVKIPEGVEIKYKDKPTSYNHYYSYITETLRTDDNPELREEECIDLFFVQAGEVTAMVNSGLALPLYKIGITEKETADMYDYTLELGKSYDGELRAVTFGAYPQAFIYNRAIAKEVLGTDEPEKVDEYVSDWGKFTETAGKMKEAGYFMISDPENCFLPFTQNVENTNKNNIALPQSWYDWANTMRYYHERGFFLTNDFLWGIDFETEKVFGFFGSPASIDFGLTLDSSYRSNEYDVTPGPGTSFDDGYYICAAVGTDNMTEAAAIIRSLCFDKENLREMAEDGDNFTNSKSVVAELSGNNHYPAYDKAARRIKYIAPGYYAGYEYAITRELEDIFTYGS